MTGGKRPGWGQREVCLPWPPGCWGQISERGSAELGQRFLWSRQSGHRGGMANQRGGWPAPGGGEVSLPDQAWPRGPWLGSLCSLSWVWAGGFGMKGLTKIPMGDLDPPFGDLPELCSALRTRSTRFGELLLAPCYLQTLPILHLLTQFLSPEACCPFPFGKPSAPG